MSYNDPTSGQNLQKAQEVTRYHISGKYYQRIPLEQNICPECGALRGQYHVVDCNEERCPACSTRMADCECPDSSSEDGDAFAFKEHSEKACALYIPRRAFYVSLAQKVQSIVVQALQKSGVKINAVDARAKDTKSLFAKAAKSAETDPTQPKYPDPLKDITDLVGVRITAFSPER